jgi:hypothetical protein
MKRLTFFIVPMTMALSFIGADKANAIDASTASGGTHFWTTDTGGQAYKTESYGAPVNGYVVDLQYVGKQRAGSRLAGSFVDLNKRTGEACGGKIEFYYGANSKVSAKWTVTKSEQGKFPNENARPCKSIGQNFTVHMTGAESSPSSSDPSSTFNPNATVQYGRATVYSRPGYEEALFSLAEGTMVEVLGEEGRDSTMYFHIRTSDGREGWVVQFNLKY